MPVLKYLTDTNIVSDYFRPGNPVKDWFAQHRGQIGISTLTLAEMRRGIELKADPKTRAKLERTYDFILEDYQEAIFVFDEAAAAESRDALPPYDDSLIAAIARSSGLTVITRNEKHFSGVATVNPWKLK